jgi:serine/threonine-protein kinase
MSVPDPRCYAFDDFLVDVAARQVRRRNGSPVAMTPRVFATLLYLLQHRGTVVGKDALMTAVWPGRIVEENNLNQNVSTLRRLFGAAAGDHRYIVTEPGRGYRFVADVQVDPDETSAPISASPAARSHIPNDRRLRVVGLMVAALLVLAAVYEWRRHSADTMAAPTLQAIAVLPFRTLAPDERDAAFELAMADALIGKLSHFRNVAVRSVDSVRRFDGVDQDPVAAGRALQVSAVLEGQIQRRGDQMRVTARLLGIPDGNALWTGNFDEKFSNVFVVQDAIADKVSSALALPIEGASAHDASRHSTRDIEAYKLYVGGRYHMAAPTSDELHRSIDLFRKAIDRDPAYALAYAGLADAYRRLPMVADEEPKKIMPLARAAALKALEIDDTLADAHASIGWIACWFDWNWTASEQEFQRAIALDPNVSEAHLGYMTMLSAVGRRDEAMREGRRALELDPLSPLVRALAASSLGSPALAEKELRTSLEWDPDFWVTHFALAGAVLGQERTGEAIAEFKKARDLSNGNFVAVASLGYLLARTGDRTAAQALLADLLARSQLNYIPPVTVASIYAGLGDNEQAIVWLQRAYGVRDVRLSFIKGDSRWSELRGDPRFLAIVARMGLASSAEKTNDN